MSKINLIFAASLNSVIGQDNKIPWHSPTDLLLFKARTVNNVVIMGRKTFESLGNKTLPLRENIVVSKTLNANNVCVASSLGEAIDFAKYFKKDIFIIGGNSLLNEGLEICDNIYLTVINKKIPTNEGTVYTDLVFKDTWNKDQVIVGKDNKELLFKIKSNVDFQEENKDGDLKCSSYILEAIK